jgi:hypothetical protein
VTTIRVCGVGFWSPGFRDARAWLAGLADPQHREPTCTVVTPRHRRYTSRLTQMSACAFEQAVAGSSFEAATVDVVFASSQGEIAIAVELLEMVAREGGASPARFMNSVHNTVPGHLSIATRSHGTFTALAGGAQTVSAAMTEALCLAGEPQHPNVVVIMADEELPPPVDLQAYSGMAVALWLSAGEGGEPDLGRLSGLRRDPSVPAVSAPEPLAANPCAPGLALLGALMNARGGCVRLDGPTGEGWCVDVTVRGA